MLLSTALDSLFEKAQKLSEKKYWFLFLILLSVVVAFINGIGIIPEEPYQLLSQNPFTTRTDIHFNNYWQETVLLPIIAYYLGLTGTITFNALTLALIIGSYTLFTWWAYRRWGIWLSLISSVLLFTSPLTTILLSWLGSPDGLTLLLIIPFLFTQSGLLLFFLALLGMTNHPTFIIAAMEILMLRWIAREGINSKHLILTSIGAGIGYGTVKLFLSINKIEIVSRLNFMQFKNITEWIELNWSIAPISIFSLFNIHWLVLFVCLLMFYKKDKLFFSTALVILFLNYGITFFTLDTTRIFSLLSWGIFFLCVFHSYKTASSLQDEEPGYYEQFSKALVLLGILSIFAPRFYSWIGEIHSTPFFFNLLNQIVR